MVLLLSLEPSPSRRQLPEGYAGMFFIPSSHPRWNEAVPPSYPPSFYYVPAALCYITWKSCWEFMIFSCIYIRPLTSHSKSAIISAIWVSRPTTGKQWHRLKEEISNLGIFKMSDIYSWVGRGNQWWIANRVYGVNLTLRQIIITRTLAFVY